MDRILFLTGRLAKDSLEITLKSIKPPAFFWEIHEIGLQVAGLMTADMIERRLSPEKYSDFDKIIVPGRCRGDLKSLEKKFEVSTLTQCFLLSRNGIRFQTYETSEFAFKICVYIAFDPPIMFLML